MASGLTHVAFLVGAALIVSGGPVLAAEQPSEVIPVEVREKRVNDIFSIEGSFQVNAPAGTVWTVLSDYEHIPAFVSSMLRSSVLERTGDVVRVEQSAVAKVLFFSRDVHLVLTIKEGAPRTITFADVGGRDFEVYRGSWTITSKEGQSLVVYRLDAKPRTGVPGFVGMPVFKATATALLSEVRAEIIRRATVRDAALKSQARTIEHEQD